MTSQGKRSTPTAGNGQPPPAVNPLGIEAVATHIVNLEKVDGAIADEQLSASVLSVRPREESEGGGFELNMRVDLSQQPEFAKVATLAMIEHNRENIEADGVTLLSALGMVLTSGITPPSWLATAFHQRWSRFERYEVSSLDDCFGHKPDSNRVRAAKAQRKDLARKVHGAVIAAIQSDPTRPVDGGLFAEVGEHLGFGKTKCEQLYYAALKEHGMQDAVDLKRFLATVTKRAD